MKKYYLYFLIVINLIFLSGCEKLSLDLEPVSTVTDANYWKTPEQFETFITGIHSRLRTQVFTLEIMGEFRADIYGEQSFTGGSLRFDRYHLNTLNSEYTGLSNFGELYTNINQLNLFIAKTLSTSLLTDNNKNYMLGQAYGIRAFYYFHLLRTWGDAVLVKEPIFSYELDNLAKPASTVSEVMASIKDDIENSVSFFADDYTNNKIFWSKAATLMLKSEVYLWSARQMGGGANDADIAKNALIEIQTNIPSLQLLQNFKDVFSYENKGNDEIIFSIRNELNEYNMFGGNNFDQFFPRLISVEGYYDSISHVQLNPESFTVLTTSGGHYVPVYRSVFRSFSDLDTRKLASISGAYNIIDDQYVLASGCWVNKYQGVFDLGSRKLVDDYPIYRYADLLLMLAEAKSLLGEDPANEINMVRKRAFGSNYKEEMHGFPNQPIDSDVDEALLKERLFEFICEGKRWYDLRRFGKNYVFKYTTATEDYQLLWPIDKSTLTNNNALVQNPGY